jgi:hypothetical protein
MYLAISFDPDSKQQLFRVPESTPNGGTIAACLVFSSA